VPSSPTVKRRRLAAELRACRDRAGMTIEDAASQLEWSMGKISRIENARVSVIPRDVKLLLGVYGVPEGGELWEALLGLSREARQKGWWREYGEAFLEDFGTYVALEAEASTLSTYEPEYVPGLLQTEDYALAVMRATALTVGEEEITRHVTVRMTRQERLVGPAAPQLWAVINEAVIRRPVGGTDVMTTQLDRLLRAASEPNIILQVLPFSAGAHPGMSGAFMIIGFPDPRDQAVAYSHYYTGAVYLEKPADLRAYTLMFDHLRAAALAPARSRELMARARDELG
jgi:transcriptional regulator with XRE-family HTH domain